MNGLIHSVYAAGIRYSVRECVRLFLVAALSLQVLGCSLFESKPQLTMTEFKLVFRFDDRPMPSDKGAVASAGWTDGYCIIRMKPEYYTHRCLGHELRHCLEGDWHKGRKEEC